MSNFNIEAFNINTGGAKVLLNLLLTNINKNTSCIVSIKDISIIENKELLPKTIQFQYKPSYLSGIKSLIFSKDNSLYFGNLPPFRKCKNSVLYIHSEYLTLTFREIVVQYIPFFSKMKLLIQIVLINLFHKNVTHIAVQTQHMSKRLCDKLKREILILPFFEEKNWAETTTKKEFDFCYVGLPSLHKNHGALLSAIKSMVQNKSIFSIALTVPNYPDNKQLLNEIDNINSLLPGCIKNFGLADKKTILEIYSKSKALIFPSKKESLGLPIIEALQHNLKVLSSNKEFSYELINNPITFNAENVNEIEKIMSDFLEGKFEHIEQSLKIKSEIDTIIKLISNES